MYLIFWGPAWNSLTAVRNAETTLFQTTLPGNPSYYNLLTQYYDNRYLIRRGVNTFAGCWIDPVAPVGNIDSNQVLLEASRAAAANGWSIGLDDQFMVLTPPGTSIPGAGTTFCAWHAAGASNNVTYFYSLIPYQGDYVSQCANWYGGGSIAASTTTVSSHEYAETATDPNVSGGWSTKDGTEVADLCAGVNPPSVSLGGISVQYLYDIASGSCQVASNFVFSYSYNGSNQVSTGCSGCGEANHHAYSADLEIVNTGNIAWEVGGGGLVRLGTSNPYDRSSAFCDSSWLAGTSCSQIALSENASTVDSEPIRPGQVAYFAWSFTPAFGVAPSTYVESMDPLATGILHMSNGALGYTQPVGTFDDVAAGSSAQISPAVPGLTYTVTASFTNTGTAPWYPNDIVRLATSSPNYRSSQFQDASWVNSYEPVALTTEVDPGQSATFSFKMHVPATLSAGTYVEHFAPIATARRTCPTTATPSLWSFSELSLW